MSAGRAVWVKVRASDAERAEWHAKARSAGLTLSDLVRRSLGRARTWTVPHADVERERTRELARVGNNLNQLARWANTHKTAAEAVSVIAHLVSFERSLLAVAGTDEDGGDAHYVPPPTARARPGRRSTISSARRDAEGHRREGVEVLCGNP